MGLWQAMARVVRPDRPVAAVLREALLRVAARVLPAHKTNKSGNNMSQR